MNIKKAKHIHFTGIKGVGMTSLALCAQDLGIKVTGSDVEEEFVTDEILKKRGIEWAIGFDARNLNEKPDLVVITGAHGGLENSEIKVALKRKIPVLTHAEALAEFAKEKELITVCGVGGKTTTAGMLATLLDTAFLNPSYAIGVGNIFPLGFPGKFDTKGKHFICESDEYAVSPGIDNRPRFNFLSPKIIIVTNIEHDHPDIYPTIADTKRAFSDYFAKVPKDGRLIANIDNEFVKELVKDAKVPVITYGFDKNADFQIKNLEFREGQTVFGLKIKKDKTEVAEIILNVPGEFNARNATGALVVGRFLGLNDDLIKRGLHRFLGSRRRFEKVRQIGGTSYYDDYAHHPAEIAATLAAAKAWFPKRRIVALFQPHTFSRTKALFQGFAKSFKTADVVALMDIYASAREKPDGETTSEMLAKATKKHAKSVFYTGNHKNTLKWTESHIKRGDVVITMGAGDIFYLYKELGVS